MAEKINGINGEIDILLVYPPISVNERYARDVGDVGGNLPPLGLAMIAAVLKEKGFKIMIIDSVVMNYSSKDILHIIKERKPKAVGITAMTPNYHRAKSLANEIKKEFPDILLIIGGHHVTIMPEKVVEESDFDIAVLGEGEITSIEILELYKSFNYNPKKLLSSEKLKEINGIAFRDEKGITVNKARELIKNLDELPYPARELLPMKRYLPLPNQYKRKPVVHMVAIRGCPYNCSFCSNNKVFGRKIRARSPEKVVEEIVYSMKKYGAKEISFWDDMMTTNREWMNKFCDLLIKNKVDITWTCYARVDSVDEPLLKKMKKAGCWNIFFGFESGVQELLDNINKGITLKQIAEANQLCKKIGIEVRASFMIALPGETPELARKTIEFAKKLNPDYAQFCITTPYPATALYENAKDYGTLTEDFSKFNIWEPVFIPKGYKNAEQIREIEKKAMREFYIRPEYILSRIRKINSLEDIIRYLKGLRFLLGFISKPKK
ncbi:MAG: radical SAM protein [archaeon]